MNVYDIDGNVISTNDFADGPTGSQIHFNVTINANTPKNGWVDASDPLNVNAVLILPNSYTPTGKPTPLIFMHHGRSGTVTDTTWYTTTQYWPNFYNAYLNAGFAVFDVNGAGPYAADNTYNHDYGCPNCILAAYAAYEYIREHYNVDRKIFVHGTSMGGITAVSFAKNFSNIVRAVGVFSTADRKSVV